MKFELSDDQALLRSATRDFLAHAAPLAESRRVIEQGRESYDGGVWQQLAEMGYLGLVLPAAVGGQGLGAVELAIVLEEMGRVCLPGPYLDVTLAASVLAAAGGHEDLLGRILGGQALVTLARDDAPFSGNHAAGAVCAGGRLRCRKYFVPFAAAASALLVVTPDELVLAEPPFEVEALPTLDPAQRFGTVAFDHVVRPVGPSALLGAVDRLAAVGASAMLLGLMSRCLELTVDYVQTRQAFRRPIGAFQALQHRLADMLLRTESTRSAVYRAAWCLATGDPDTALACAAAKAYAGDAARLVTGEAIQMHGGIGFTWELDLHLYLKRAKTLEQHYGSTERQLEAALTAIGY